ncbi:SPOR domain-containing protein [Ketogulonicigenium vulgare]|uniref:Sporulation and cell division repeat protein n=1 Tax=Ketogulonicigenium vulgare (strain WSH-001) TaxID=759362 RepID=F9Y3V2_KETVW|nr:SPOR domain-containing protein [Ketogulonicigenium vulgare]AEM41643.1 Sporulation and cell division repeat protein [Ketogulonicigenium vulgare WSH-001]ALJ81756.1 sporulation protein [Ketogulonicigenium vulgare]ANW34417.1 sporulation protein [Ketogulonicigenium vulgare]AOZ55393.1 Sporulation and cell division repeat protein [Ketogulonicigenium vulgare]
MASITEGRFGGDDRQPPGGKGPRNVLQMVWLCVSLGLMVAVGVWGYRLLLREAAGIPTVHASTGPVRTAPEVPGGSTAQNIGLSVNAVLARNPDSMMESDVVILAPQGAALSREDLSRQSSYLSAAGAMPSGISDDVLSAGEVLQIAGADDPVESIDDLLSQLINPPVIAAAPEAAAPSSSGIPRPRTRPTNGAVTALAVAAAQAPVASAPQSISADVPAGTPLVQLGAFPSTEGAANEWTRLSRNFADFLRGKTPVIQQATNGGNVIYRLRASGFTDLEDARRFCALMVAENGACIPVSAS